MASQWDTVVIGAGLGGLTAAARLVQAGLRVLVLERNPHPGGTAFVYHRKGFSFPMGPLGFSTPGVVQSVLEGVGQSASFAIRRVHYGLRAFDLETTLSRPFAETIQILGDQFPGERVGIEQFFRDMETICSTLHGADDTRDRPPRPALVDLSASAYLQNLVSDRRVRRILGSLGAREPYTSIPLLAAMWNLMANEGIWYPDGGMRGLCLALTGVADGRHRSGSGGTGELQLGQEVAEIRIKKGQVLGVTLSGGTTMDSPCVISNADFKTTFLRLMDVRAVPEEWSVAVTEARQTGSILQVCLGVDAGRCDLSSFKEASRLLCRRPQPGDEAPNWDRPEIDPRELTCQELEVSLWSQDDPTLAPDGGAVVIIRVEAPHSHFVRYRPGWRRRSPAYVEYKDRLGLALVREAEHLIPGLEKSLLFMDVATPLTFEEAGGRSEGAVAGWSWDYEEGRDFRPRELVRTPVRGLYMAGYQAFSTLFMGGVPTATESGLRAAAAVLQRWDPLLEPSFPGRKE